MGSDDQDRAASASTEYSASSSHSNLEFSSPNGNHIYRKSFNPLTAPKTRWSSEEDAALLHAIQRLYGGQLPDARRISWALLKDTVGNRSTLQLRERYMHVLDPSLNRKVLCDAEMKTLLQAQVELGNKWTKIAELLPGRTSLVVKNAYYSAVRRFRRRYNRSPKNNELLDMFNDHEISGSTDEGISPTMDYDQQSSCSSSVNTRKRSQHPDEYQFAAAVESALRADPTTPGSYTNWQPSMYAYKMNMPQYSSVGRSPQAYSEQYGTSVSSQNTSRHSVAPGMESWMPASVDGQYLAPTVPPDASRVCSQAQSLYSTDTGVSSQTIEPVNPPRRLESEFLPASNCIQMPHDARLPHVHGNAMQYPVDWHVNKIRRTDGIGRSHDASNGSSPYASIPSRMDDSRYMHALSTSYAPMMLYSQSMQSQRSNYPTGLYDPNLNGSSIVLPPTYASDSIPIQYVVPAGSMEQRNSRGIASIRSSHPQPHELCSVEMPSSIHTIATAMQSQQYTSGI